MRRGRELDAVSAALAEVQARQQSLSRGAVLPRASSPPTAASSSPVVAKEAAPQQSLSRGAVLPRASSPPTAASSSPVVAKEAAPRRPPPSQWLQRRVVRRSERQETALEDLGSLELLPSASLAAVRALVVQFIALPPRREFRFVHPTTGACVDVAEESGVPVAGLPFLCIALLPVKEVASGASAAGSIEITEERGRRPATAQQKLTPQQTKPRPQTVESSAKRPGVDVVMMTAGDVLERAPRAADKEMSLPAKKVPLAVDREVRKAVGDRKEEGTPARVAAASAGSKRATGELRLALETPATSRASILLKPEVKLSPGPTAVHKVSEKLRNTTQRDRSVSIRPAKEIGLQASTELAEVLLTDGEREPVRIFSPRASVPQENTSSDVILATTLLENQDVAQENATHDSVRTDEAGIEMTLEATTSSERETYRKPGPLRRSRHFKALSVAKLAERIWSTEEPGDQELVSDEHIEKLIRVVVDMFYTDLPGIDSHQLSVACQYYGIDYQGLGLQGLLLALDGDFTAKCNHVRGGVDGQLTQYLLKLLPAELGNVQDVEVVRHFENSLNLFAGMRGWQAPTKLRASVFEDKQRLQLIPVSDSRRLALLRLTDKDRQLFALASAGNDLTGLEKWLADCLEITYVLLYGFLHSRRNSGPKSLAKLETVHGRQERILAAVQKLSSFSFEVWKRLEFRTSDIEDISMVRRLNELLRGFVQDSNVYSSEVEGSVFFPAIVGYLARKSDQLGQSLSGLMISATRGPQQSAAMECLRLLRQLLQQQEFHLTATETYLANTGLKIIDVDKVNASRSSSGLGRIFVSGKESILTQYQCKMMARDPALHMKARCEQQEMASGKIARYFFVGAKNTALEYSFVRVKPDTVSGDNIRWEDREAWAKKEAQSAFALFCGESLAVPLDAAIGVGINLIHTDLLPHISSLLSLSTVLREYSATTSISLGYCYEPATHSTRVVFRVHADACKIRRHVDDNDTATRWRLPSLVKAVDRFLGCASEEEAVAFCEAEGLGFLYSCLQKQGNSLRIIKFGMPFSEYLSRVDDAVSLCQSEILLQTIKRTVAIIPRALQSITRQNIQIIIQLIEDFPASLDLGDEAVVALQAICSNGHRSVLQSESMHSAFPMTSVQRQFSTEGGLDILVCAATRLQGLPARKKALEIAVVTLLTAHEFSALKSGLLTHWREWLEFYVEKKAWKLSAVTPKFSVFLLRQLHGQFFALNDFMEPIVEMCSCGCNGRPVDTVDACAGIMQIFVHLMLSELGVIWAQDEMQGPQDCVSFLLWSVQQNASRMKMLQQLILQSLSEFLERLTSSHQYLQILSLLTPQLLALLNQQNCPAIHSSTLRVLSIIFRLAVDKKVWLISLETFLTAYYQIIECICDDPSSSDMNAFVAQLFFKSDYPQDGGYFSSKMVQLLHEEHVNFVGGSGQLSPVARSRTKSFLQSLVSFCSLTWNSVLQPHCQIPAVISLGWMLHRLEVAEDLALLGLDEVLMSLMEGDNSVLCILATRACSVFFFQALLSRRTMDEHRLKRLCNLLTTALRSGTRLMLSPKRKSDSEHPDTIQFVMSQQEIYVTLLRYSAFNTEKRQQQDLELDDAPEVEQPQVSSIWENSEWSDSTRASAEKLTANLKLLTVFSSMTTNIALIGNSDEIRQILLLLVIFVRDRVHSTPHHVTLYLLPLRNIIWATRSELAKWGLLELTEATFLRKLLQLSMDRVYQELASAIIWGLADAYEKTNTFLLSFEVDDALTKGSYFTKKTGFAVLVSKLSSRIASAHCVESEAGALASMVANSISGGIFVTDYGYPFVLKLIDSSLRSIITGHVVGSIGPDEEPSTQSSTGELFGTTLFYAHPIKHQKDRELLQLCRSATKVLDTMLRTSPDSILDEAARTKATMLPLLNYPNKQIALHAIRCCSIHLQGHPTKCGKLFIPEVQDKVVAFFFEETYPPIQAAAFSCMKLALADQKSLGALQAKIWPLRERIVSCLRSPEFQVKRKAIVFLVEAIFRFDDQKFVDDIAGAFTTPENHGIIMDLIESLSKEIEINPAAGGALQSVIRLILKLDLVAHTNGDQLVHALCLTLKAHSTDTFLRPTLFDCLRQIVTQDDRIVYLGSKSRLDAITGLLSQQLTLNELRNVVNMLFTVARKHDGIRRYLSGFTSSCIPKLVGVVNSFSEYANHSGAHIQDAKTSSSEVAAGTLQRDEVTGDSSEMVLLKVTTAKTVYISQFTEDIYEQFLNLLLLLITGPEFSSEERYGCLCEEGGCSSCDPCDIIAKTRCGHYILRIAAAHRVMCATYDLTHLLSATGNVAETILNASTEILEILSANHQSRVQMLRGAAKWEWSWMPYLVRNVVFSDFPAQTTNESRIREASAEHSILLLGHLSAAKEVALRLVSDRQTILLLFSYLSLADPSRTINVDIRRAASFTLARLAEHPAAVVESFFQERMAMLTHPVPIDHNELESSEGEHDTIVLVNRMVLGRNRALHTPGLQGRSVDEATLTLLIQLLIPPRTDDADWREAGVGLIAADVLSHLLFFRANARDEKRLRAVLWRYARAMSPTKPTEDQNRPSSKRLTAYLDNWIGPMLQKLRQSAVGASRGDTLQLLQDELSYSCQQLGEDSTVSELLRVLVILHIESGEPLIETETTDKETSDTFDSDDTDAIVPYTFKGANRPRKKFHVAFNEADRSTREANDNSFHGYSHLWLFLQKLWELAIEESKNGNDHASLAITDMKEIMRANLPKILERWHSERGTSFSLSAVAKRQSFLEFVILISEDDPGLLGAIDVKTVLDVVVGYAQDSTATLGREYHLLCCACHQIPQTIELILQFFRSDGNEDAPNERFCLFWQRVRLTHVPVQIVHPTAEAASKTTILDLSPDTNLATIFGVELLKTLTSREPLTAQWYALHQGTTQLLDMMLLASRASALQLQHLTVRSFLSNLLYVVNQLVDLDQDKYRRVFERDPRYIRCVVDLICAPAHEVQSSAIKLVQNLALHPPLFGLLSLLESLTQPLGSVRSEAVAYVKEILSGHQISPPFSQDRVVLLAHIWLIPILMDLSVTELVKLSLGFSSCTEVAEDCWVLLTDNFRFSAIPEWMLEANTSEQVSFNDAMKHIQKRFEGALHQRRQNLSMYGITKEAYMNSTTVATRRRVALRLGSLLKTYQDETKMYRSSVRSRNGLVMRLGRFLVEDRAEIIRRVAYTKRIPERMLFDRMQDQQLSDLLTLLQENPLFEDVPRDHLANLALRLGAPVDVRIVGTSSKQRLPLLLVFDEAVEFEMCVQKNLTGLRGTLPRGGLLGFPPWLENADARDEDNWTVVYKCQLLATTISREILESELPEPSLSWVNRRLRQAYEIGDVQAISELMGLQAPKFTSGRRRLQSSASALLVELTTADVFINNILNDSWAIRIIVDVAQATLPPDIVLNALTVVAGMTANEDFAKRFCAKAMRNRTHGKTAEISSPLNLVFSLVNQFKLQLWLSHPEILAKFFLVQAQVACYLPSFWPNLEKIWSAKYMSSCLDLLRSGSTQIIGVVGCHLGTAIPHRADFLLGCGNTMDFHLALATILSHTRSGNVVGVLRLFNAFCVNEKLREEIWENVVTSSQVFDGALQLVASATSECFDLNNYDDIEVYCNFLHLMCSSGIDEILDSEFQERIQIRCGILSVLLARLPHLLGTRSAHIVLRCIGSICFASKLNSRTAATTLTEDNSDEPILANAVISALTELIQSLRTGKGVDFLLIEATFSCVDIFTTADQMKSFSPATLVAVALQIMRDSTATSKSLNSTTIPALAAVVRSMLHVLDSNQDGYLEAFSDGNIQLLCAGYECISGISSEAADDIEIQRLLGEYTELLGVLLSSRRYCDLLWTTCFQGTDSSNLFVTWMYRWIIFKATESPKVQALIPARNNKRLRLLAVADKMQSATLSLATRLSMHEALSEILSVHPDFGKVVAHIFAALSNSNSDDIKHAIAGVRLLCFVAEQWDNRDTFEKHQAGEHQHLSKTIRSLHRYVSTRALLKACRLKSDSQDSFVCYAVRFLWLLVKLQSGFTAMEFSCEEWLELVPLASDILRRPLFSGRTKCYVVGLLAELSADEAFLVSLAQSPEIEDVVKSGLMLLNNDHLTTSKELMKLTASSVTDDFLSSRRWSPMENREGGMRFGVSHELQRFILHLYKVPEIRQVLSNSSFFHPMVSRTVFVESIALLSTTGKSSIWATAQLGALELIAALLAPKDAESRQSIDPSALRSYRLVARREGFLQHCVFLLLEEQTHDFELVVIESLLRYMDQHTSASLEVAALREQGRGDLMNVLLSMQNVRDATQNPELLRLAQQSLQLYISCIEFSFKNAVYAAKSGNLSILTKQREGAASDDTLISSNLPQIIFCTTRMLGRSNNDIAPCFVSEIWGMVCAVLLHPEVASHFKSLCYVLEIVKCSENWKTELCEIFLREWQERGRLVVECLVRFVNNNHTSTAGATDSSGVTIAELSAKAIMQICSSAQICEYICNDSATVASLLHHSSDKRQQTELLKFMVARENTRPSLLDDQILVRLAEIYQLGRESRLFLFELLPSVTSLLDRCDGIWSDMLACILAEISCHSSENKPQEEDLTAARALYSVVNGCDLNTISREMIVDLHVVLKQLIGSSTAIQDCAPSIFQDENCLHPSMVMSKSAVVDLMFLYSLSKLSPYIEPELPLVEQFGPSCCSIWICMSTSRGYSVKDEESTLLLGRLVFYYLRFSGQSDSLAGILLLHFRPYWRIVVRMFTSVHEGELYRRIIKLLLQLVQGPANHDIQEFVSNTMLMDLIDELWWQVLLMSRSNEDETIRLRGLWCSLLHKLCCSRANGLVIMEKRFLEQFILLEYRLSSKTTLEQPGNTSLLRLLSEVFRVTSPPDHEVFFRKHPTTMETLADHCIRTIAAIPGTSETIWNATQVLSALALHEQTLTTIRNSCGLDPRKDPTFDPEQRRVRLCALSELLLLCGDDIVTLAQVLTLILKIFGSREGIAMLIRARIVSDCWPMVDVLVEVLQRCMLPSDDTPASRQSQLRPILLSTSDPAEFLPCNVSTEAHANVTSLALRLVRLCVDNHDFAESLKSEIDLLEQLFVCLATSNWMVSSTGAAALSSLIGCVEDWDGVNGDYTDIARYMCDNGIYRKLEFFTTLDAQNTFAVSPPSLYPPCFVLLTRWIRFYSVNLQFLGYSEVVVPFDATEEDPRQLALLPNLEDHDVHETITVSVLDLLLYWVSNFHSEIYKNGNGEEEEREHSLLLQSLLSLCQRRFSAADDAEPCGGGDPCIVVNGKIRSRSLELVLLLCSLELLRTSSVQVFASAKQMLTLMMIVERSASTSEQCAASQLIVALARHYIIKNLLVGNSTLLSRLGGWLENEKLQLLAVDVAQLLAIPTIDSKRSVGVSVFNFSPSVQQQLAHFLIVGRKTGTTVCLDPRENVFRFNRTRPMVVTIQLEDREKQSPRSNSTAAFVLFRLGWKLLSQSGRSLRSFLYDGTLQSDKKDFIQYELMLEQAVATIHLTLTVWSSVDSKESSHEFELPASDTCFLIRHSDTDTIRITQQQKSQEQRRGGVLPRLLSQERADLSPELFQGLSRIVVEFSKSFALFCDPVIDLPSQMLVVLATSVSLSPVGRMDVACLDGLATWFPSKPSIAFFKKSISPLLHLIQGLRRLSCVTAHIAHEQPSNEAVETAREIIQMDAPEPPQFTFLEKFIELIASVEVADWTPNCLNVVFMENADVLLYLCAQFAPDQDRNATFLSLVAIAVRSHVAHCQAFLMLNAQSLLRSVFDVGIKNCGGRPEYQQSSLLSSASLVVMRLARCPITNHDSSAEAARLELFSRVSFEVFARREWVECFPHEAARNLVLACGFLSDGIAKPVAVDAGTSEAEKYASLLVGTDSRTSEVDPLPSLNLLTAVETLLLFLGRSTRLEDDGQVTSDSFDRLAARILASLIEKLPARKQLEQRILELLVNYSSGLNSGDISLEERCLSGMRKCLFLTRYDSQSDLNALRLTYYSSIRAGVRTGIIPPQCSGVFQHFDQEHLLPTQKPQWHLEEVNYSRAGPNNGDQPSVSLSKHLIGEDLKLESELRELLLFANKHAELLSVLIVNRKKAMTTAFRVATRNARVLVAFHAMTSIALDFYIDSVKRLQNAKKVRRRINLGIAEQTTFMEWLLLLEELAGLICSGLHELDASYYTEIARQFKSLIMDLPVFLRKMERLGSHSRQQALLLFLDNLHRLLKRATNQNELRVVAANGSGVIDQTKTVRERLKRLDPQISASLGLLLESQDGMESLSRALVAMTYMWRRTMGATSLEKAMATSKESASLLKKIKEKLMAVVRAAHRPRKVLRAVLLVILKFWSKPQAKSQRFDSPAAPQSTLLDTNSGNTDQSSSERDAGSMARGVDTLLSPFPLNSLELALDHFGWESLSAKRTKLLLQLSSRKSSVIELLSSAFGASEEAVERLSVLELADHFHTLEAEKKLPELLERLGELTLSEEMAFTTLPSVSHDKMDMSLWRLMVRPIQRVRLFHLYQQAQRFVMGDRAKRKLLLDGYRQNSPQKPASLNDTQSTRKSGLDIVEKSVPAIDRRTAVGHEPPLSTPGALSLTAKVLISQSTLSVCDGILSRDPLSDDAAMRLLRKKNSETGTKPWTWWLRRWVPGYGRSGPYHQARPDNFIDRALRAIISFAARFVLVVAFWRQDELHADLHDPVMARAFDDPSARDDYYRLYHAKKGLGELVRVWMPSSGRLGLSLWQERRYAFGGTLMSIGIALWLPRLVSDANDDSQTSTAALNRNVFMTRIVYSYGVGIFVLSVVSIALIAQNRFVLLEQTRLRLRPISRYYQNSMAVAAIVVELVQLNSLAFDAAVEWDDTGELPAAMQWLGQQGLTQFGVSSVSELQALVILLLLLSWFLLLKCANKFQDTSVLLHRVLTKDLPALVNGFFYMGTISAFFSFLACADCSKLNTESSKCVLAPQSPPFLIAHPSVTCWTSEHQWYALLGLWGITFFLPIGLLAHGMSQVLFQRETLDIKYAPVLLLVTQLVKAVAATAQAFFPFEPLVLASLGFVGNGVLLILTLAMHSCSLWYIKYVKCSIYAASCWASLGAIHRLHYAGESSTRSLNMIYFGWLTILLATAAAILLRVWRRARAKQRDADLRFAAQQRLLNVGKATGGLGAVEQKFLNAATKHSRDALTRAAFLSNASRLEVSAPPPVLKDFVTRAKEGNENDTPQGVLFMQNARVFAKKLQEHDGLRRRR